MHRPVHGSATIIRDGAVHRTVFYDRVFYFKDVGYSRIVVIPRSMSSWSVYMLRCVDGSLYIGISTNVEERVKRHNAGKGAAYTRSHLPVTLIWTETAESESAAKKREAGMKRWTRQEKLRFVNNGKQEKNI